MRGATRGVNTHPSGRIERKPSIVTSFEVTMRRFACAVVALALLVLSGCSGEPPNPNPRASVPLTTVPVDLPRYMGRWYIIANIPYFAERDFVGSYAQWVLRPDGKIDDSYYAHKG